MSGAGSSVISHENTGFYTSLSTLEELSKSYNRRDSNPELEDLNLGLNRLEGLEPLIKLDLRDLNPRLLNPAHSHQEGLEPPIFKFRHSYNKFIHLLLHSTHWHWHWRFGWRLSNGCQVNVPPQTSTSATNGCNKGFELAHHQHTLKTNLTWVVIPSQHSHFRMYGQNIIYSLTICRHMAFWAFSGWPGNGGSYHWRWGSYDWHQVCKDSPS